MSGTSRAGQADAAEAFDQLRRHLSPKLALTGNFAGRGAVEERAEGCRVTLSDGRTVLDFGSYAVTLLGHRHPAAVAAVRRQLDTMPTSTRSLANPVAARAAACLSGYLGDALPKVYFGLNGADVVEVAVKLARLATGRGRVLAVRGGFHGKSLGALALTHSPLYRVGLLGCLTDVVHLDPRIRRRCCARWRAARWPPSSSNRCRARTAPCRWRPRCCGSGARTPPGTAPS